VLAINTNVDVHDQHIAKFEQVLPQAGADAGGENAVDHAAIERGGKPPALMVMETPPKRRTSSPCSGWRDAQLHAFDVVERSKLFAAPDELQRIGVEASTRRAFLRKGLFRYRA